MKTIIPGRNITNIFQINRFPAGEINVHINPCDIPKIGEKVFFIEKSFDLMTISCKVDILRTAKIQNINLVLPYMPYARQDRYTAKGYSFALEQWATHLALLGFERIFTVDVHSSIATNIIPSLTNLMPMGIIKNIIDNMPQGNITCIAPDTGATLRVNSLVAKHHRVKKTIFATKIRDAKTGNITSISLPQQPKTPNILIIDDICDGGRTFIELKKLITNPKHIELFVSHGLFSKPDVFTQFNKVHSTDSIEAKFSYKTHKIHPLNFA